MIHYSQKKIFAPNYSPIPNVIFDYWMTILSHVEFKVLLFICRKTFGWHKERDRISLSQLEEGTGSCRKNIVIAINSLIEHGLIEKKVEGENGTQKTSYEVVIQEIFTSGEKTPPPSGVSPPTKETLIQKKEKEKITKEKERPSVDRPPQSDSCVLSFGNHVKLKKEELESLYQTHGKQKVDSVIDQINDYISSTGKKCYKDYAATIRNWIRRRDDLSKEKPQDEKVSRAMQLVKKIELSLPEAIRKGHIVIGYNYIEFNLGFYCDKILFSENGFEQRCMNNLRKMNVTKLL